MEGSHAASGFVRSRTGFGRRAQHRRKYIACACNILYAGVTLWVSSAVPALPVFRWTD